MKLILRKAVMVLVVVPMVGAGLGWTPQAEALTIVEPDSFANGANISNAVPGVTLSAFSTAPLLGFTLTNANVISRTSGFASTGTRVFGNVSFNNIEDTTWFAGDHQFRADFTNLVNFVSIDIIANDLFDPAILRVFDSGNTQLASFTTTGTAGVGVVEVATITRPNFDIDHLTINNPPAVQVDTFLLDNLQFNPVPEPSTMLLLGSGLAGLGFFRWRRKAA